MTIDLNDPRLTAYALNELDSSERAEVERLLADSLDAQAAVADIHKFAERLTEELPHDDTAHLTARQRQRLEQQINKTVKESEIRPIRRRRTAWLVSGIAAGFMLLIVPIVLPSLKKARMSTQLYSVNETESERAKQRLSELWDVEAMQEAEKTGRQYNLNDEQLAYTRVPQLDYSELCAREPFKRFVPPESNSVTSAEVDRARAKQRYGERHRNCPPGGPYPAKYTPAYELEEQLREFLDEEERQKAESHQFNTEAYDQIVENPFNAATEHPLSTFSIDVDTASYSNIRRFISSGQMPPRDSVRIEEMINYFSYDYPLPEANHPFSVNVEIADCPWNRMHRLAKIGLKGYEVPRDERPACNLVFLLDVSGSMRQPNKLPLLKKSMRMLVEQLDELDRVAIVVYAGASGVVLDSTSCDKQDEIMTALDALSAGGSTNGGAGIQKAYDLAAEHFIEGGVNRVILATDGDFNVGITNRSDLIELIQSRAKTGVFISVLGFGMGNYKDGTLENLADKGNGNYAYVDTATEAKKVLVDQLSGTLVTIAKDIKIQIEFNPAVATAYRLIGYENRILAAEDFNDDTKDAGEIGAGHTVTALYEIIPFGARFTPAKVDPLKYQKEAAGRALVDSDELMTVKLRYKKPDEDSSTLIDFPITDEGMTLDEASEDFHFAAAVASFGMLLRDSQYMGEADFATVLDLASAGVGQDTNGYRAAFVKLVEKARSIAQHD